MISFAFHFSHNCIFRVRLTMQYDLLVLFIMNFNSKYVIFPTQILILESNSSCRLKNQNHQLELCYSCQKTTSSFGRTNSDIKASFKRQKGQKLQRTHRMWVSFIEFRWKMFIKVETKMFIFWNISRCKSTTFRSS